MLVSHHDLVSNFYLWFSAISQLAIYLFYFNASTMLIFNLLVCSISPLCIQIIDVFSAMCIHLELGDYSFNYQSGSDLL